MDPQTRIHKVLLKQLTIQRRTSMNIGCYYRRFWPYYLIQITLFGSLTAIFWNTGSDEMAVGFVGLFTGIFLRDLYWFRMSLKSWRTLEAVIDWNLVDISLDPPKNDPHEASEE